MNEEERIQLLDDYLHKRLTAKQRSDFQQKLASDPGLQKELEIHELLMNGITLESKKTHFRKHLADLRKEAPVVPLQDPVVKKSRRMPVWGWAAGLAAMLLTGIFFWWERPSSGENLFTRYYEPYPSTVLASVTRGDTLASWQQLAVRSYENNDYQKAIPLLKKLASGQADSTGWLLILGISYLETDQYQLAESSLKKVVHDPDSLFYKQGQWYLALTYLKQNKTAPAKSVLQELGKQSGIYARKANQLLSEL
ncbi:tetratricopeptide repeat protein [Dyadobacter sediminis]|uniref:Tetratricopeptide repeat protein n=1 Tax=Dyadobacter sediminis TaxID=1493691 RepID=A0A5R9KIM7_9BACT|nr:tetratricopeptide repeat protein [Dyadobacter sediminis]TLU96071.1 hypothetical protein FEM55_02670 [Dyadobacter sediminis]GGB79001.1 hypothetical protein GCM10011325_03170 [Dyadobacter sediminis]